MQAEARVTELERALVEARDRSDEAGRERDEAMARSAGLESRFEEASTKAKEADARSQSLEARIQDMAKDAGSAAEGLKQRLVELEARTADAEGQRNELLARAVGGGGEGEGAAGVGLDRRGPRDGTARTARGRRRRGRTFACEPRRRAP